MNHHPFSMNRPDDEGEHPLELDLNNVSASSYLEQGNRHYYHFQMRSTQRELDSAIHCYRRALDMEPELASAYVKLAATLWDKGGISVDNALNYCHLALTYDADNHEAHLHMGYFLRREGRLEEAIGQFKQALAKAPFQAPKARMALGVSLINEASAGLKRPALERLTLTLQGVGQFLLGTSLLPFDQKNSTFLLQSLGSDLKIQTVLGIAQSFRALQKFNPSWDRSCALYEWATQDMPSEPIFFHLLGDYYQNQDETETAIYFYNRTLELEPENLVLHKKLAKAYTLCEDASNTVHNLQRIVEADDSDFDATYALAQAYSENKEYMRALYYFKSALRLDPHNQYVHSNMAYVLFKLEDPEGAIEEYRLAISHGKDPVWTATVAQTLGTIYYQVNHDVDAAIDAFTLASELDPTNLECLVMLAELYFEQGNMQGALDLYQVIQQCDPENPDCHNYVGYLLWQMDRNDEAIQSYNLALNHDPNNPVAYNNLGVIYLDEQFNADEAQQMFGKALQYKPDYTLAAFNLGRSQELLGHIAEAAKSYSTALELNISNPEITNDEIQERLEELFKTS